MKKLIFLLFLSFILIIPSVIVCGRSDTSTSRLKRDHYEKSDSLSDAIARIISHRPGEIGVAIIINNADTVVVNDTSMYPMMSVFKLHQAIAICDFLDHSGISLDSVISVKRDSLDPNTWSPLLKEHPESEISLSLKNLLRYSLIQSDNNVSNLMFERFVDVTKTDNLISTIIPRESFQIAFTEHEMASDHRKAYSNYTSPLGAAILINRVFTESLLPAGHQEFIKQSLGECITGLDRIVAPLMGKEGVVVAHKTGSGYVENGILAAHNDVAYIMLPNGVNYSLAIFVKDFAGNEKEASEIIAHISKVVYDALSR